MRRRLEGAKEYAETIRGYFAAEPQASLSFADHVDTVAHWVAAWNPNSTSYMPGWWDWLTAIIGVAWCRWEWWRTPAWLKNPDTILYLPEDRER